MVNQTLDYLLLAQVLIYDSIKFFYTYFLVLSKEKTKESYPDISVLIEKAIDSLNSNDPMSASTLINMAICELLKQTDYYINDEYAEEILFAIGEVGLSRSNIL